MTEQEAEKKFMFIENQVRFLMQSGYDTVQIFTTHYDAASGDTRHFICGNGNWCARYGQVRQWVNETEGEQSKHGALRLERNDDAGDGHA